MTFDPSAATSEALAAASAINLCEEVLKTPASKPRRMSLRRMSIEGLLETAPPSDKENEVHEDNIIRYEGRERGDTESAIKKVRSGEERSDKQCRMNNSFSTRFARRCRFLTPVAAHP